MDMVRLFGQMEKVIKDNIWMIKNMVKVCSLGIMEKDMKENGLLENKMAKGLLLQKQGKEKLVYGKMEEESK